MIATSCLRNVGVALVIAAWTGCETVSNKSHRVCYTGVYTLGAGESVFVPIGEPRAFYVFADDMPESVYRFLLTQPKRPDRSSESGNSVSALVRAEGRILINRDKTARFHATKIFYIKAAK